MKNYYLLSQIYLFGFSSIFQSNKIDFDISKRRRRRRRQDLVQKVIGSGAHRKIILASGLNKDSRYHSESLSYAMPQPTLEFGMLCLKKCIVFIAKG